jgi:AcrR family transcriptional regulator
MRAALEEFNRSGLNGVRIEVIAREAKVSKQLIYYYYGSRDILYEAILEEYSAIKIESLLAIDYRDIDPIEAIRKLLEEIMTHFEGIPLGILTLDCRPDDAMYLRRVARRDKVAGIFNDIVDRGMAQGIFSPNVDKKICFELAGMMIGGFFVHQIMWREGLDYSSSDYGRWRNRIVDTVVAVMKRGTMDGEQVTPADMDRASH